MDIHLTRELLAPAQHIEPPGADVGSSAAHTLPHTFGMESTTSPDASGTEPSSLPEIPIDPLLLAWVPPASVPAAPTATTDTTGSVVSPAVVVPPHLLQSTLADYQRINSPAPLHGFPVVSADQEQRILSTLSLPSALQLDITIRPFAYLAAMPTAAEVVQICDVPESLYGRVKLEMYPIEVQRRAVIRMWRSFHWQWNNEADVKKFVSKELGKRFNQSKRTYDKKQAKLAATQDVANAAGLPAAALTNSQTTLTTITNLPLNTALAAAVSPSSEPAPTGSSGSPPASASSNAHAAWTDPDFYSAREFLGEAFWNAVDYTIATDDAGAFNNWREIPAVGLLLQDWLLNTGFLDNEDVLLEEMDEY
ncbi:hypothetical protein FPQ18DRAFT_394219 [Pyronema domesticum]|nr:hypothetical protein FPQ18DRAFT_394219 [Pyronema domesticum]